MQRRGSGSQRREVVRQDLDRVAWQPRTGTPPLSPSAEPWMPTLQPRLKFPAESCPPLHELTVVRRTSLQTDPPFSCGWRVWYQGVEFRHWDRGGWWRWLQKVNGYKPSRVIQKPGMRKDASASIIQHDQDDCLPLLSLLTVFIWLRIHASSLVCVPIPAGYGRMASDGSCDQSFP